MDSTICFEVLIPFSPSVFLFGDVFCDHIVRHIAKTATEMAARPGCRPRNCFFRCGNSAGSWCPVFLFSHCISRLIGTCTWSFDTRPFMIDTSC